METRHLTIREAAAQLRVYTRTINRRLPAGMLTETQRDDVGYILLVDVPTEIYIETATAETLVSGLQARLKTTEADRDHWRRQAETLSRNASKLTATLYRLTEQKPLPAPDHRISTHRHWREFWKPTRATS